MKGKARELLEIRCSKFQSPTVGVETLKVLNNNCTIEFLVPHSGNVKLTIYNLFGQEITTLMSSYSIADKYKIVWDTDASIANGIYFIHLTINDNTETQMITINKE